MQQQSVFGDLDGQMVISYAFQPFLPRSGVGQGPDGFKGFRFRQCWLQQQRRRWVFGSWVSEGGFYPMVMPVVGKGFVHLVGVVGKGGARKHSPYASDESIFEGEGLQREVVGTIRTE